MEWKIAIFAEFWGPFTHSFYHFEHLRSLRICSGTRKLWQVRQLEDVGLRGNPDTACKTQAEANSIDINLESHEIIFCSLVKILKQNRM